MGIYKVELEGASNQDFSFVNYDDALQFVSMVIDHGAIEEYHYDRDAEGNSVRASEGWRPIKAVIYFKKEVAD